MVFSLHKSLCCMLSACLLSAGLLTGCGGSAFRPFPLEQPLLVDPDRRPFAAEPEEYFSPFGWDAANQTIFRPVSQFFAVNPAGKAINVNALDEVPDSSWFTNRIGRFQLSPAEVAKGPCVTPPLDPAGPWKVVGAKPNGANPGFLIEGTRGDRYLLKLDGLVQGARATSADVVASRIYHAAGYFVPCNRIVFFERGILRMDPEAEAEDEHGDEVPLQAQHIDRVLSKGLRLPDGRYRASASLFIEGKPIGPWTYEGTRDDDPNDVVPHEERRDLRGARIFAAWTNHFDSREQNTLGAWVELSGGLGYVRHYLIDFGDCFGSVWDPPLLGRRIGHAYYLDFEHVVEDFVTFGLIERPWDVARFGPTGAVFGYFNVAQFDPEDWRPGYPNPAFSRMQEGDAAWAARILARLTDQHVQAMIEQAKLPNEAHEEYLAYVLMGRRRKILERYLTQLSPLSDAAVSERGGQSYLCLTDLATLTGVAGPKNRSYRARAWLDLDFETPHTLAVERRSEHRVCVELPQVSAMRSEPEYVVVDVVAATNSRRVLPLRAHLYAAKKSAYRLVGIQRPDTYDAPAH